MSSPVVFPVPPPTSNTLSKHQRRQMLKSTNKLARILGCTPRFMEESTCNTAIRRLRSSSSIVDSKRALLTDDAVVLLFFSYQQKRNVDDDLSSESSSDPGSPTRHATLRRSDSTRLSPQPCAHLSRSSSRSSRVQKSPPSSRRSSLEICRASHESQCSTLSQPQLPSTLSLPLPGLSLSKDVAADQKCESQKHHGPSLYAQLNTSEEALAPAPPTFLLPSTNTVRRQKMDRLKRTLGDDVPVAMVFPEERTSFSIAHWQFSVDQHGVPAERQLRPEQMFVTRPFRIRAEQSSNAQPSRRVSWGEDDGIRWADAGSEDDAVLKQDEKDDEAGEQEGDSVDDDDDGSMDESVRQALYRELPARPCVPSLPPDSSSIYRMYDSWRPLCVIAESPEETRI
ncbi:hypothetical protein FISHEDRAFT_74384 [Fistulina hepatica ATCC 64428]|uniref:Uncharacterized protein n=1 Tax=Fistulina hepatica ATCC 64428 TaxID=1128425 RepID=A0A0D7AA51_9AGAR|nr:hypothetical protein FISHEDRAFT_74384 [Fistulina hepatica ATCC 64428]